MRVEMRSILAIATCAAIGLPAAATAQTAPAVPAFLVTPDKVETRIGTLHFNDGPRSYTHLDNPFVRFSPGIDLQHFAFLPRS